MAARADVLGDVGDSAPDKWEDPFRDGSGHVMVMVSAKDPAALAERQSGIVGAIERRGGATVVGLQDGAALEGGREHFGYADGFAQPSIEGSGFAPEPGAGAVRRLAAAQGRRVLLGYTDEQGSLPPAPPPDDFGVNGSYLVYRKLHQDVAAFRRLARATPPPTTRAARSCWPPRSSAAGATARRSPSPPIARTRRSPRTRCATTRSPTPTTPTAWRCPIGAHVRRMNPRRSLPFDGKLVNRHRIMRRGITVRRAAARRVPRTTAGPRRDLHVPAGEHRPPFEFVQSQWAERRQRVPARRGPGRDRGPARHRRPREDDDPGVAAVLPRAAVTRRGRRAAASTTSRPGSTACDTSAAA